MIAVFLIGAAIWSVKAPVTTTIRVGGFLNSSAPAAELQHAHGGRLAEVHVRPLQHVAKGDTLFVFDVASQVALRDQLRGQLSDVLAENALIDQILGGADVFALLAKGDAPERLAQGAGEVPVRLAKHETVRRQILDDLSYLRSRVNDARAEATDARNREIVAGEEIALVKANIALGIERAKGLANLSVRGVVTRTEADAAAAHQLMMEAEERKAQTQRLSLSAQSEAADRRSATLVAEYRARISARHSANRVRASDVRQKLIRLDAEIAAARVVAPRAGVIAMVAFDTAGMVAGRGRTLASLANPLEKPTITLHVPIGNIDQVYPGVEGRLTISALPQRGLGQIGVVISEVLPEAIKDRDGNALHYLARAEIRPEDLERAKTALGARFRLATDMPVNVALAGRDITFFEFLFKPFTTLFSGALQDA